jgi:hypothetical protein
MYLSLLLLRLDLWQVSYSQKNKLSGLKANDVIQEIKRSYVLRKLRTGLHCKYSFRNLIQPVVFFWSKKQAISIKLENLVSTLCVGYYYYTLGDNCSKVEQVFEVEPANPTETWLGGCERTQNPNQPSWTSLGWIFWVVCLLCGDNEQHKEWTFFPQDEYYYKVSFFSVFFVKHLVHFPTGCSVALPFQSPTIPVRNDWQHQFRFGITISDEAKKK